MLRGATRMHAAGPAAPGARGGVWSCLPLRLVRAGAPPSMSSGVRLYNGGHDSVPSRPGPGRHRAAPGPGAPGPVRPCGGRRGRGQPQPGRRGGRGAAGAGRLPPGQAGRGRAAGGELPAARGAARSGGRPAGQAVPAGGRRGRGQPPSADLRDRRPPTGRDGRGRGADLELQAAARRAGREAGRRLAEEAPARTSPAIGPVLEARGYEPYRDGAGLRLRNCPSPAWPASSRW